MVCFLCWSCSPKPTYHSSSWYEVQQRQALPFLVYCSLKRGELCSLFSRLPARFSWCFWIRWKTKRTGTSSAAALLTQHALLTQLTLGNSLTFLSDHTYNKPLRQLWSESLRGCYSENGSFDNLFESREWCAIRLSSSQCMYQREQLEQRGDSCDGLT